LRDPWHGNLARHARVERKSEEVVMPRGDKSAYTDKQKRQAAHIEDSEKKRGRSDKRAAGIAWATVNKQDGGGKRSGAGRARAKDTGGAKASSNATSDRSAAARKGWRTRRARAAARV
jgi:hypothetical protein